MATSGSLDHDALDAPRRSPLDAIHRASGARFTSFSGWEMPLYFGGIVEEHLAVRERAGLFDISHLGRVIVGGEDAGERLRGLVSCDPRRLAVASGRYCLLLTEAGGIADDLIVFRAAADPMAFGSIDPAFLLIPNAGNTGKVMVSLLSAGLSLDDVTERTAMLALQGPRCADVLSELGVVFDRAHYSVGERSVGGCAVTFLRSGYTGEDGVEVICKAGDAAEVWHAILAAGEAIGIAPCGLGSRDTLRLEKCYPLWGQDIDESISPVEATLMFAVEMNDREFRGRAAVAAALVAGAKRRLVPIDIKEGIARRADALFRGEERVGVVTSGTFSPTLKRGIALAHVDTAHSSPGTPLRAEVRGRSREAMVTTAPFV